MVLDTPPEPAARAEMREVGVVRQVKSYQCNCGLRRVAHINPGEASILGCTAVLGSDVETGTMQGCASKHEKPMAQGGGIAGELQEGRGHAVSGSVGN